MKRFLNSLNFAIQGIRKSFLGQYNIKIQSGIAFLAILLGIFLEISRLEWIVLILTIGVVISFEMLNTAIETIVNLIQPEIDQLAKRIKDIAAGSVLFICIVALIIGFLMFLPRLIILF